MENKFLKRSISYNYNKLKILNKLNLTSYITSFLLFYFIVDPLLLNYVRFIYFRHVAPS